MPKPSSPRPATARPATAKDVAQRAGVSRATVSHIFNGREARFPEATREKVRRAAAELSYRPWSAGRSLVTGRGDTIVAVMPRTSMGGMPIQDALERLTADLEGPASNVVLRFADIDPATTARALLKMRPLAVVDLGLLDADARAELESQGIPTVPRAGFFPASGGGFLLRLARLQVEELVRHGRRRIVYAAISDQRNDTFGDLRFAAIEDMCATLGLQEPLWCPMPLDIAEAVEALESLPRDVPLGVAAYNDHVALATLAAARELGIQVPLDLAVIGHDDIDIAALWSPSLSSVAVDVRRLMDSAAAQLEAVLRGAEPTVAADLSILRLVSRQST
ncbi:LacI family DNA-binding transcriptional regulator [Streptomyces fractus]|uniref:LacI family DNA-binding transcriptional regulator n=1 Tax=Streptomyces fractus TaxID=641806 RepID=UPI003CF0AC36